MRGKLLKDIDIIIYSIIVATLFLLICTKSSPLYPINDWVDSNAFLTMGKGMMDGSVLYKDLFEQKGPFLYLIHGLASFISYKTFFGVYIFEVISCTVLLFFTHKIINLYFEKKYSYIGIPLIAFGILNLVNFAHGDSAEEFAIPFITISLYYFIKYFKDYENEKISYKVVFLNGVMAGIVLWIKYSLLGFFFAWMMMVFFSLILKKEYKRAVIACFIYLGGMGVATIPWIIYFGYNGAIKDWISSYIFINLNSYSVDYTIKQKIYFIIKNVVGGITRNKFYGITFILGFIYVVKSKTFIKDYFGKIALLVSVFFTIFLAYCGGRGYIYYFLVVSPFIVVGILFLLRILNKYGNEIIKKKGRGLGIVLMLILLAITFKTNHNVWFMKVNKEDLFQYKFAKIINETKDATLLNYGSLDNGLYLTTGISPKFKHFEKQNIHYAKYKENIDEQNRYVEEGLIDYVLVRHQLGGKEYEENDGLKENYNLIITQNQKFSGFPFEYRLYKRKDI